MGNAVSRSPGRQQRQDDGGDRDRVRSVWAYGIESRN